MRRVYNISGPFSFGLSLDQPPGYRFRRLTRLGAGFAETTPVGHLTFQSHVIPKTLPLDGAKLVRNLTRRKSCGLGLFAHAFPVTKRRPANW